MLLGGTKRVVADFGWRIRILGCRRNVGKWLLLFVRRDRFNLKLPIFLLRVLPKARVVFLSPSKESIGIGSAAVLLEGTMETPGESFTFIFKCFASRHVLWEKVSGMTVLTSSEASRRIVSNKLCLANFDSSFGRKFFRLEAEVSTLHHTSKTNQPIHYNFKSQVWKQFLTGSPINPTPHTLVVFRNHLARIQTSIIIWMESWNFCLLKLRYNLQIRSKFFWTGWKNEVKHRTWCLICGSFG